MSNMCVPFAFHVTNMGFTSQYIECAVNQWSRRTFSFCEHISHIAFFFFNLTCTLICQIHSQTTFSLNSNTTSFTLLIFHQLVHSVVLMESLMSREWEYEVINKTWKTHRETNKGANQELLIIQVQYYCPWFNKKHRSMERNVNLFSL